MKRLFAVAALVAALVGIGVPAHAAGTISLSLSQQFDATGRPLIGCRLYLYEPGTTTPQTAYQDAGLTIEWPWPMRCDASGRLAQFFLPDGQIKVRLTDDAGGYVAIAADYLLVIGPSSGSGSGGAVDATTVLATGDLKWKYGTGPISGWVRANGRTIGSATSGATERANADCQALFEYLWNTDSALTVSSGRGASANADWLANKTIALPDARGRVLAALDDMGNSAAGRLTSSWFGASGTVLGAVGGSEKHTLTDLQIPAHWHPASIFDPGHTHTHNQPSLGSNWTGGSGYTAVATGTTGTSYTGVRVTSSNGLDKTGDAGGGQAHPIVQPTILSTLYLKL